MSGVRIRYLAISALAGCGFSVGAQTSDASIDSAVDAPPDVAADAFSIASCGPAYTITHGLSRYRFVATHVAAWTASENCAGDHPKASHLVVLDNMTEQNQIQADLNSMPNGTNMFWIGAVQRFNATSIGDGWIALTGGPVGGFWNTVEPTDNDGSPPLDDEAHAEQFVRLDRSGSGMVDAPGRIPGHGYICECDGKPIDPIAAQAIADSTGI